MKLWLALVLGLIPNFASAFPDMIRHGYVNCSACHVSPQGGNMLNAYGRSMSKEVLSAWGYESEPEVLHGALPALPEWWLTGGDVRAIQIHRESPTRKTGKWFLMQAVLELGVKIKEWTAVIAIGETDPRNDSVKPNAQRYYVMWNPQEQLSVRAGRFTPVFGINMAYHTLPTRMGVGLAPGLDRDTVETMWSGEEWNIAGSASRSAPERTTPATRETMVTAQVNRAFNGTYRVGASYLQAYTASSDRSAYGVHALLGFTHKWAYLSEFAWTRQMAHAGGGQHGLLHFSQLIYEPVQGLQLYFLEEYQKTNLSDSRTLMNSYGPGLRFFPRPHFEFDLLFTKKRNVATADRYDDSAWILTHYYF